MKRAVAFSKHWRQAAFNSFPKMAVVRGYDYESVHGQRRPRRDFSWSGLPRQWRRKGFRMPRSRSVGLANDGYSSLGQNPVHGFQFLVSTAKRQPHKLAP